MITPHLFDGAFNCPYCAAYAHQTWGEVLLGCFKEDYLIHNRKTLQQDFAKVRSPKLENRADQGVALGGVTAAQCAKCKRVSIWFGASCIHPASRTAPFPNSDMPDDVRLDYEEAASIAVQSPRGAAALLRVALEKLCAHLGQGDKKIDAAIGALVADGLHPRIQKSLDALRVIGNSAVHPGLLDLRDNHETASMLFRVLNLVVENTISQEKHINAVYDLIPEKQKGWIEDRDRKSKPDKQ